MIDAQIQGNGLVAMTSQLQFIAISNLDEPRPKALPDLKLTQQPGCWGILNPDLSRNKNMEIFVSVKQTIFFADQENVRDQVDQFCIYIS